MTETVKTCFARFIFINCFIFMCVFFDVIFIEYGSLFMYKPERAITLSFNNLPYGCLHFFGFFFVILFLFGKKYLTFQI